MARQKKLSNYHGLNSRLIYDYMESNNVDYDALASLIGCHKQTLYSICRDKRIPRDDIFLRLQQVLGKTREELIMPLVGCV